MAVFAFFCLLLHQTPSQALEARENPKEVSWRISALMVTYDKERDLYIAEDDVVITGGETRLEADYVEYSDKTKDAFAQGNVLLISGEDTITCNAMQINLATQKGTINKGTIFVQDGNYYISGENLRKTGAFTYDAEKGTITTCDGDAPDWKITGHNIKVTVEGYGTATNTALWAKKVPVIYSPYLVFPTKTKRQTGLLMPRIATSERKGFEYEQPLFIALSRSTDATVYADYMADRGLKGGVEFRYVINEKSQGAMFMDYLDDDKIDDGSAATKNYAFSTTPQRTNHDRWWFRMKHDQELPRGFNANLDVDLVSDADYLQEFRDGFSGFDNTNDYFNDTFGRSLDEYSTTVRKNSLLVSKAWATHYLNVQGLWYDDIIARRQHTADTTLQTLPSVEFDAMQQNIGNTGFYYSLDSEFRSFYRQDTTATLINGQRMDIYPRIYYPTRVAKAFAFEPYLGVRSTAWHTPDFTDNFGNDDSFRTRELYDTGASLSTTIDRVFHLNTSFAEKLRHEIIPKLEYAYQPNVVQDDLPLFDSLDRLSETNLITWSVTNIFTTRAQTEGPDGTEISEYKELAWIKFYQDYDIKNERDDTSAIGRPWQDLKLKYELNPFTYLSSNGDVALSPYDRHFTEVKIGATIKDNRGDSIYTSYRYQIYTPKSWLNQLKIQVTDELMAYYSLESDLETKKTIESKLGIEYTRDCWAMALESKEDSSGNRSIAFMVLLNGIGEFDNR